MLRIRRDRRPSARFLRIRIILLFLAVGVWLAGSMMELRWLTAVAIGILVAALVLGWVARGGED